MGFSRGGHWAPPLTIRRVENSVTCQPLRKYKENGQNHTFRSFDPLNVLFYANFIAYHLGADARHILGKIWGVKIFVLGQGGSHKGLKNGNFFSIFS